MKQPVEVRSSGKGTRRRWGMLLACLSLAALLCLGSVPLEAGGAGRSRPGGSGGGSGSASGRSSGGSAPPQRASGRATYGHYSGGGYYYGYPGYYGGYYGAAYYGWGAWPWGWWYAGYPYTVVQRGEVNRAAPGVIETDVEPKKANVLVDGEFVGQARDYNGHWDLLWLDPGTYRFDFAKDGYMTLTRHLRIRGGMHVRIIEQLQKGEGPDPRSSQSPPPETPPTASSTPSTQAPPAQTLAPSPHQERGTLERGLLRMRVEPGDAAVYLDGEFLARAGELARLHGALPVARGVHTIEVVRPGFESRAVEVEVGLDEPARVEIVLQRQD